MKHELGSIIKLMLEKDESPELTFMKIVNRWRAHRLSNYGKEYVGFSGVDIRAVLNGETL